MDNVIVTFEPLTKKDSKGKIYNWFIFVENKGDYSVIVTQYGYNNKTTVTEKVDSGTNLGKKNETDHFDYAVSKAKSKWEKKRDLFSPMFTLPMLALEYNKTSKIDFPVFIQPKLDGYRMLYDSFSKKLYTRTGKQVNLDFFEDIKAELDNVPIGYVLDGEFYSHDISFEKLGVIRKQTLSEQDKQLIKKIKYFVYDIIDASKTFEERKELLKTFVHGEYVECLETLSADSHYDIEKYHKEYISKGYEGTIIRNKNGLYRTNIRSKDLLKYKNFKDAEFPIVSFTHETCGLTNLALVVWVIQVTKNIQCNVRPKGTVEERNNLYKECVSSFSLFKNSKLWVKFFEYTEDGNLRFPTTKTNSYTSYIRNTVV
jgi:DNA ligase 1